VAELGGMVKSQQRLLELEKVRYTAAAHLSACRLLHVLHAA
jgi:hypothetical protein